MALQVPNASMRRATGRRRPRLLALVAGGVVIALGGIAATDLYLRSRNAPTAVALQVDPASCYVGFAPFNSTVIRKPDAALTFSLTTDAEGMRVDPKRSSTASARCRILALGDSFTAGLWVQPNEAFPAVLERVLRERGYDVRVDNGGVQGHTIAQERIGYLGRWRKLHPSIVLVARTANDVEDLARLSALGCHLREVPRVFETEWIGRTDSPVAGLVQQTSAGAMKTYERVWAAGEKADQKPMAYETCQSSGDEYLAEALDLAQAVKTDGGHLLFAGLEKLMCSAPAWNATELTARYLAAVNAAGAGTLEDHSWNAAPGSTLAPVDSHPSPQGHERIASSIAARLETLGWLQGCR